MAIKINGSTIIDDSRKGVKYDSLGIGTTNATAKLDVDGTLMFLVLLHSIESMVKQLLNLIAL